ncbi:MAG: CDP-diacylglycerol--serine O-phosphatidyltransferase [Acidobacteria bacterium]|nr:CDP-diacylglycerol--serine O-phosphatidyltransferase [Acidobacteriota bacterium]
MVNPVDDQPNGDSSFDEQEAYRFRARSRFRRDPAQRRQRLRRGVYLLPSLFTLGNMFCGYLCILYAIRGEFEVAAPFIGLAVVLDMLDGRIARMTKTESAFGVEFDSLADVISFGIAPAVLAFMWGLEPLQRLGWAVGFIYVAATAIRLARFNIQTGSNVDKRYFVGLPSPAAAAIPATTVFFYSEGFKQPHSALIALAVVLVPAFLMVSTIRFWSFKTFDLHARRSYKVLGLVAIAYAALTIRPQVLFIVIAYTYLLSGFVGLLWGRLRRRRTLTPKADTPRPTVP